MLIIVKQEGWRSPTERASVSAIIGATENAGPDNAGPDNADLTLTDQVTGVDTDGPDNDGPQ